MFGAGTGCAGQIQVSRGHRNIGNIHCQCLRHQADPWPANASPTPLYSHPFGALLLDEDGTVLLEAENTGMGRRQTA